MTPDEELEQEERREEHLVQLYMELTGASREQARSVYEWLEESGQLDGPRNGGTRAEESKPGADASRKSEQVSISSGEPSAEILMSNPRFA